MVFDDLNALNINGHTEQKDVGGKKLTYLSWPWAWAEVKKRYPDAHYSIWKNEKGLPYTEDPMTGYMVYTSVTIDGITHEMWLPVMDGANKAMKSASYEYKVKNPNFRYAKKQPDGRFVDSYGKEQPEFIVKTCEAASMMDINKTVMRCLVKNLAMFGLGLYIYAGEDLPEAEQEEKQEQKAPQPKTDSPKSLKEKIDDAVKNASAEVVMGNQVPAIPKREEPKKEVNPVTLFLLTAMSGLRQKRNITAAENNKLFAKQKEALVKAKLAPDKKSEDYTMEEATALIDAMEKCFDLLGTELKTE